MKPVLRFFLLGFLAPFVPVLLALIIVKLGLDEDAISLAEFLWVALLFILGVTAWVVWMAWPRAKTAGGKRLAWRKIGTFAAGLVSPFVLLIVVLCAVIGVRTTIFMAEMIFLVPHNAGPFHRAEMESLVAQVRNQKFEGEKRFTWSEASGLLPDDNAEWKDKWVDAERGPDGHLKVVIVTHNEGHAGVFGFAYSDDPLQPTHDGLAPDDKNFLQLDVPGPPLNSFPRMKIDAHWWEVFDGDE